MPMRRKFSLAITLLFLGVVCGIPEVTQSAPSPSPDYFVSSTVDPYFATDTITIHYSAANLSDARAPATRVKFMVVPTEILGKRRLLGYSKVPALRPWQDIQQTVTFRTPRPISPGVTAMQLISHINPEKLYQEANTSNNVTVSGFGLQKTVSPPPPTADLTISKIVAPATIQAGALFASTDTVQNLGTRDALTVFVSYFLKANGSHIQLGSR